MLKFFTRTSIKAFADDLLYDAERKLLEHEAAAEHHAALANMYRARAQRMRGVPHSTHHGVRTPQ